MQNNQQLHMLTTSLHLSTQNNEITSRKSLTETLVTTTSQECCPSCDKKTNKVSFYSCCLSIACSNCFSGFHYLQCPNKSRATSQSGVTTPNERKYCQRCEQMITTGYYSCRQCKIFSICQLCFNQTHSSNKFKAHSYKKVQNPQQNQSNILICTQHKKIRNIITQSAELICNDCANGPKLRKFKHIDYLQSDKLDLVRRQIQGFTQDLERKAMLHSNQWNELKRQLSIEYEKLCALLKEKYQQNMTALNQMEDYDMRIVNKALIQSKKALKESLLDCNEFNISNNLLIARLNILSCQLSQSRQNLQASEQFIYKITEVEKEKFENIIKNFTITKLKLRETQDKENQSIRKSNYSSQKPNISNLSLSRRSLDKSVSKANNFKQNDMRSSAVSIHRPNMTHQQINTVRNSTPPQSYKIPINSSDKKSALMRQNSIMSAKLQDITPVILNFDSKQTSGSRINFLSNKTQEDNPLSDNNISQSRASKRKSDFFDIRDRMRKPNMNSMINNRFVKR